MAKSPRRGSSVRSKGGDRKRNAAILPITAGASAKPLLDRAPERLCRLGHVPDGRPLSSSIPTVSFKTTRAASRAREERDDPWGHAVRTETSIALRVAP